MFKNYFFFCIWSSFTDVKEILYINFSKFFRAAGTATRRFDPYVIRGTEQKDEAWPTKINLTTFVCRHEWISLRHTKTRN